MDAKDFIKLLDNPQEVEKIPVDELKKLSLEYPYSQPVQLLYTIRLSQSSEYLFSKQLAKTSILTDDRSVLFDLFERDKEEVGTTTVITQTMEEKKEIEPEPIQNNQPLISQLEAAIKPESPKEVIPEPIETKPQPELKPVAETVSVEPKKVIKEVPKPKLDLTGLSPQEKVQAILAENKRIREEMASKKAGQTVVEPNAPVVPSEPEVTREAAPNEKPSIAQQPQSPVYYPPVPDYTFEQPPVLHEVSAPEPGFVGVEPDSEVPYDLPLADAIAESQIGVRGIIEEERHESETSEIEAAPVQPEAPIVFTIDEDIPESVFQIDDQEPYYPPAKGDVKTPKEPIVGKAYDHSSEKHSFAEWLQILKNKEAEPEKQEQVTLERAEDKRKLPLSKKLELLDSFVEKLPEIKRKNLYSAPEDKPEVTPGKYGGENDDMLVTETLAKVYISQKHYEKAIKAFEILKLKYPEKSSFFADQISMVRNLINSK